jgi:hypothetical protein
MGLASSAILVGGLRGVREEENAPMSDFTVTRRSIEQIEQIACDHLSDCPKLPNGSIDVLTALRQPSIKTIQGSKTLRLKLVADQMLPEKLAQMWASKDRVTITARASLWNRAEEQNPESLKDLRHEYCHGLLHSNERTSGNVALDRQVLGNKVYDFITPEQRAEDQADWLAACLALPRAKISPDANVQDIVAFWNVTLKEALWRLERIRLELPKRIPETMKRRIETLKTAGSIPDTVQALWDGLPYAPDLQPSYARIASGFLVEYSEYRKYTQTGWSAENGRIVPLILKMQG